MAEPTCECKDESKRYCLATTHDCCCFTYCVGDYNEKRYIRKLCRAQTHTCVCNSITEIFTKCLSLVHDCSCSKTGCKSYGMSKRDTPRGVRTMCGYFNPHHVCLASTHICQCTDGYTPHCNINDTTHINQYTAYDNQIKQDDAQALIDSEL